MKSRQIAPLRDVIATSRERTAEGNLLLGGSPGAGLHTNVRGVAVRRTGMEIGGDKARNGRHGHWVCVALRAKHYRSEEHGRRKN